VVERQQVHMTTGKKTVETGGKYSWFIRQLVKKTVSSYATGGKYS
jgi:hypothetical protein